MEETEELQEIVKEYFSRQENSDLKLCIYEEKAGKDIEWFYDKNKQEWCYFKTKKERYEGEPFENIYIERKKFKTFGKKCHITEMSFFNFMTINAIEYFKHDGISENDVNNYIKWWKEEKEKNPNLKMQDLNAVLNERYSKNSGCLFSIIGFIGLLTIGLYKL